MIPTLVFDIETIPDTDGLKGLLGLPVETSADDVAKIAFHQRRQQNGSEFLPLHQHKVVAISCVLREGDNFKVWSLGAPNEPEGQLIQRFFDGIEKCFKNPEFLNLIDAVKLTSNKYNYAVLKHLKYRFWEEFV